MPRTFKATIALIVTLVVLSLLTLVNLVQTNNAENVALDLQKQVNALTDSNQRILQQLQSGVAVSGTRSVNRGGGDEYAKYLDDPDNILVANKDLKIPSEAQFDGTLRQVLSDTPKGYNWVTENSVDVRNIQYIAHQQFARRDLSDPDNLVPELAYKIEVNDDYTEYIIHLREGVYWHTPNVDFSDDRYAWLREPRELKAEDAVFFFELVKNDQVEAGALKNYYEDMEKAEVIDDYTFKVTWKKKVYHSLDMTVTYYPMPKWLFTRDEAGELIPEETLGLRFNSHWASKYGVGVGPYQLMETRAGERVVLERFDKYWGDRYPLERIELNIIKDPEAAYLQLKADEIDFMGNIPAPKYKSDIVDGEDTPFTRGELNHRIVDRFAYYYVGWNADGKLFRDKDVRKAMTHALNREGIIRSVLHGLGTVQTGPFYYKHPAMNPDVEPIPFDLEKSKALLAEAGWADTDGDGVLDKVIDGEKTRFEFSILAYDSPTFRSLLAVFKEDLRKIGIVMTPQPVDWPTMQKRMDEKNYESFTGGWGMSWLIDPYQIWHSSQADIPKGSNRVGFRNERADTLIETLRETFDADKRIEMLREFHSIVHEEQPYTFFYAPQAVPAWQPRLQNVIINPIRPQYHPLPWYIDDSVTEAQEN